ncbi:MAG: hypothetical protein JWM21_2795 [Acidobacteria bacterium]|nr:hypothetical protein [Acidobacteriota bacterium]
MKSKIIKMLGLLTGAALWLVLLAGTTIGQQPDASPTPTKSPEKKTTAATPKPNPEAVDMMGDYTIVSSLELGYRALSVTGDRNKYQSDLNNRAGLRIFDSSFLARAKEGKGGAFDTFLVTSTGWGSDPYGSMRVSVEKSRWYRFDGNFRRFKYFNFLNNLANPNFATQPPNPITGQHGYDVRQSMGDFDLTLLPKNENFRFTLGVSPERYSGPAYTTYHVGGDDFKLLSKLKSRSNDFRVGVDGKIGSVDISFLQGFRRFREDSSINNVGQNLGVNPALSNAFITSFLRNNPVRGHVNYSRLSAHTLVNKKLDLTGRIIYSKATTDFGFIENITGINWNTRVTGAPTANTLNLGSLNIIGGSNRPNALGDFGLTWMATDRLRLSNTFRVETFQISGGEFYTSAYFLTRTTGVAFPPILAGGNLGTSTLTKYRKIQDTVEADYQFNNRFSMHAGYRYGTRHIQDFRSGANPGALVPSAVPLIAEDETNHTQAVFGGFKARPANNWTIYFDAERGSADNVFTRVGNYNHTNVRAKSRYAPTKKLSFNLAVITRNNSNPSEIGGVSLTDFGVNIKSRVFTSSVDWTPSSKLSLNAGYNYNWLNSDAVVDYFYLAVRHPTGHSQYFMRNNFFTVDAVAHLSPRATLYAAYRINKDLGQGSRREDPTGAPGFLVTSYPMSFQSPEARLAFKINNRIDWNVGYQYYNYRESPLVGPGPQNYHAHMPYTSLRVYFGKRG